MKFQFPKNGYVLDVMKNLGFEQKPEPPKRVVAPEDKPSLSPSAVNVLLQAGAGTTLEKVVASAAKTQIRIAKKARQLNEEADEFYAQGDELVEQANKTAEVGNDVLNALKMVDDKFASVAPIAIAKKQVLVIGDVELDLGDETEEKQPAKPRRRKFKPSMVEPVAA